jgi:type VI secretion system secreted protein Hcp
MLRPGALTLAFVLGLAAAAPAADPTAPKPATSAMKRPGRPVVPAGLLKIDGIGGDRPDGAIEALSLSFTCAAAPAAGASAVVSPRDAASGQATGKRQHRPLTFVHHVDKASPKLAQAAAKGTHIPRVLVEQGGVKYELEQVLIGMVKPGPGAGNLPTESVSLNFAKCTRR